MNHDRRTPHPVTIEDLLRLKKAERPPAEFWNQFERDMRIKQLAAIVEPRPWWAPLIRVSARLSRYQLPVGATAVLALTLVTVREYRMPDSEPTPTVIPAMAENTLPAMPGPAVPAPVVENTPVNLVAEAARPATDSPLMAVAEQPRVTEPAVSRVIQPVAMPNTIERADSNLVATSFRSLETNLAAVKASEPEMAKLIERLSGAQAEQTAAARAPAVDPMVHMKLPSDSRRARLLASALPVAAYATAEVSDRRTTARVDRDLTDERLYDSISRFGVKGNELAIKF